MAVKKFAGAKAQSGGKFEFSPDSYFGDDFVEMVLGVTEGPIAGLKDGSPQNFFIGDTPVQNISGSANFDTIQIAVNKGSPEGEPIILRLGGAASSITVNTELSQGRTIVRPGSLSEIDWLELRFVINRLYNQDPERTKANTLELQIEYKALSSPNWLPAVVYQDTEFTYSEDAHQQLLTQLGTLDGAMQARRQRVSHQVTAPAVTSADLSLGAFRGHRLLWIDANNVVRFYASGAWNVPNGLTIAGNRISFEDQNYVRSIDPGREPPVRAIFMEGSPGRSQIGDLWQKSGTTYWFNGSAWVGLLEPKADYDPVAGEQVSNQNGIVRITERISSPAPKELRVRVDRITEPYELRVTKLTADSENDRATDVTWESIQEVKAEPLVFPKLATVHVFGRSSNQFSSLPELSGIYQGRIVRVPTNYDPVARTYNGAWDGLWKLAYTNNPAFIVNDLVTNDDYGLASAYPVELDPIDVYEAGAWCDHRVGASQRPQFTFNGLISEPRSAREAITYVAGIFGGRFLDDGNGYARLKIDKNDPAVHLFTKENVEGGMFTYGYSEMETRVNDYTVVFTNPDLNWQEDRRRVRDQDRIDTYGRVPDDFIAVGCTNAEEAIARARAKLITDQTEVETVTFTTNRIGLYLEPYDIFLVADDSMDDYVTGRITGYAGNRVTLRDPVYLEAGFAHKLVLTGFEGQGFTVLELPVSASSTGKSTKELTLTRSVPAGTPTEANFSIDSEVASKAYRLMSLTPGEHPDTVTITGLEVNRNKWTQVHEGGEYVDVELPEFDTALAPVPNLRITPETENRGARVIQNLRVSWDAHLNKLVRRFEVYHRFGEADWVFDSETTNLEYLLTDVLRGRYTFRVRAVSFTGEKSTPAYVDIDLNGDIRLVTPITNLRLLNEERKEGDLSIWNDRSAKLAWDLNTVDGSVTGFEVKVYDDFDALVRTEYADQTNWEYALEMIQRDAPTRDLSFGVSARDALGNLSDEVRIFTRNPAPPILSPRYFGFSPFNVFWDIAGIPDYAGCLVWVSEEPGFDPAVTAPTFDTIGDTVTINVPDGDKWYIRVAAYDWFGKSELNVSSELELVGFKSVDFDPPDTPTGFAYTSEVLDDGRVKITFTWNANTEEDLAGYQMELREIAMDGTLFNWVPFQTNETVYEVTVPTGTEFVARLRAFDTLWNYSIYTEEMSVTGALDSEPPAAPTGVSIVPGFNSMWVKWVENTEPDLNHYELFVAETDTPPAADAEISFRTRNANQSLGTLGQGVTRFVWVRAVDTSRNASEWTGPAEGKTVTPADIADMVTEGVPVPVDALPQPITAETPQKVYLRSDKKIYAQLDGKWVEETDAQRITGKLLGEQIADLEISAAKLAAGAVEREKIARGAVIRTKIKDRSISSPKVRSNAITAKKLRAAAVVAEVLAAGAVTTDKLDAFAVTAQKIGAGEIGALHIKAGSILAEALGAGKVISMSAQIGDALIDDAKITSLNAAKLIVDSVVAGNLLVQGVNRASTRVGAGQIELAQGVALSDWRFGNGTQINGNRIAANTIAVNAAQFGMRGVQLDGVEFEHNSPSANYVSWTGGAVSYTNDSGSAVRYSISGGNARYAGSLLYLYYQKDTSSIQATTSVYTAFSSNNIVLATYNGGADLDANYGRTIVEGSKIKTGSVMATQIGAGQIKATHIDALQIRGTHIQSSSIVTDHLQSNAIVARHIAAGQVTTGHIQSGSVDADKISARAIDSNKIAINGVDVMNLIAGAATSSGWMSGNGNIDAYVATRGGVVVCHAEGPGATGDASVLLQLFRNGTLIAQGTFAGGGIATYQSTGGGERYDYMKGGRSHLLHVDGPPYDGTWAYQLRWQLQNSGAGGPQGTWTTSTSLVVSNLRR